MPVIEQDGGAVGDYFASQGRGRDAGGKPGLSTVGTEKSETGGFTGLFHRGIDVEIRSGERDGGAVGMKNPESQDGALGIGADQELGDGFFEGAHYLDGDRVIG